MSFDAITAMTLNKAGAAGWFPGATGVDRIQQLSGGEPGNLVVRRRASVRRHRPILRRAPAGYGAAPTRAAGLEVEAALMQRAYEAGIPSPRVRHVLREQDGLGRGFVMDRVAGETIPRKFAR